MTLRPPSDGARSSPPASFQTSDREIRRRRARRQLRRPNCFSRKQGRRGPAGRPLPAAPNMNSPRGRRRPRNDPPVPHIRRRPGVLSSAKINPRAFTGDTSNKERAEDRGACRVSARRRHGGRRPSPFRARRPCRWGRPPIWPRGRLQGCISSDEVSGTGRLLDRGFSLSVVERLRAANPLDQ
jgi:hypothetical protein